MKKFENCELIPKKNMTEEEWLRLRKEGIGGSDVAAILGVSLYKSAMEIYLEKISDDIAKIENESMYWGIILEDIIAKEFQKRTGYKVTNYNFIIRSKKYPFMFANIDRLIYIDDEKEYAILECKTANEFQSKRWKDDEVPDEYYLQCQHYLAITGLNTAYIAALIGGNKFIYKKIQRDEELIKIMIEKEEEFWNNVVNRIPPQAVNTKEIVKIYNEETKGKTIELDTVKEIEELEEIDEEIKTLEEKKEMLKARIMEKMKDAEEGIVNTPAGIKKVLWKTIIQQKFDSNKFKIENPELYRQYIKETRFRQFKIVNAKG